MKNRKLRMTRTGLWAAAIATGALMVAAGPSNAADDGILLKARIGNSNYCHMKFPELRPDTLSWDRPVLQNPSTGSIVDFYGSCDYDPRGKAAVDLQKRLQNRPGGREYSE